MKLSPINTSIDCGLLCLTASLYSERKYEPDMLIIVWSRWRFPSMPHASVLLSASTVKNTPILQPDFNMIVGWALFFRSDKFTSPWDESMFSSGPIASNAYYITFWKWLFSVYKLTWAMAWKLEIILLTVL